MEGSKLVCCRIEKQPHVFSTLRGEINLTWNKVRSDSGKSGELSSTNTEQMNKTPKPGCLGGWCYSQWNIKCVFRRCQVGFLCRNTLLSFSQRDSGVRLRPSILILVHYWVCFSPPLAFSQRLVVKTSCFSYAHMFLFTILQISGFKGPACAVVGETQIWIPSLFLGMLETLAVRGQNQFFHYFMRKYIQSRSSLF